MEPKNKEQVGGNIHESITPDPLDWISKYLELADQVIEMHMPQFSKSRKPRQA